MKCPSCALDLPSEARFCLRCGAAQPTGSGGAGEERRIVTVVFCDLVGSTELAGALDPEVLRAVLLRYYELVRECVEAHGGVVEKFIGDAVMAVFGLAATREDDAVRAAAAAVGMADVVARLADERECRRGAGLAVRVGVHTGEVVTTADPGTRQALVSGDVVNIAARLQTAADRGGILISAATRRAAGPALDVSPVGPLKLKGVAEPVEAARLLAVTAPDRRTARFDTPFVGRETDLHTLTLVWEGVVGRGESHLLTLVGEAGVGKSRLVAEWLDRHRTGGLRGLGRCRPAGAAGSLGALAECLEPLVARAEGLAAADPDDRLVAAIRLLRGGVLHDGTPSPSSEETCAAIVNVLTVLAADLPVLLVVDDCHEADRTLLDVLDQIVRGLERSPVLVLCVARPELMDAQDSAVSDSAVSDSAVSDTTVSDSTVSDRAVLLLDGLPRQESETLAAALLDLVPHAADVMERIVRRAGGNPLYLEQLATAIREDGAISADHLPTDLHALLAARIDRLGEGERLTLRHAAVLESEFDVADLCEIAAGAAGIGDCEAHVRALVRHRFLIPCAERGRSVRSYRFVNSAVRLAAYEGLTRRRRADLHACYAEILCARQCSDARVGVHLARAYGHRAEVGPLDGLDALRLRAAEQLSAAGGAALRRVDLPRAQSLLERAATLLHDGDPQLPRCLERLGEVLLTEGDLDAALRTLRRAIDLAQAHGLAATAAHARLQLAIGRREESGLDRAADAALRVFARERDELGLARCRLILAGSLQRRGRHGEALSALDLALAPSGAAADDRELANTLGAIGLALWLGPQPAPAAVRRCEELLAEHGRDRRAVQATLGFPLTLLYAIQLRNRSAEACRARTRQAMTELGHAEAAVFAPLLDALTHRILGRAEAADAPLREALDSARKLRSHGLEATVSLELARVRLALGDPEGADALVSDLSAGADRPADGAGLLGIKARIAAARGADDGAPRTAARAVAVSQGTDSPIVLALACLDQAHVLAALGSKGAGVDAARAASRHYAAKGHAAGVAQARSLLEGWCPP